MSDTTPCGRLYDPKTDNTTDLWPCNSFARWVIVPRDGVYRYACGLHVNTVLAELVDKKFTDLAIQDLRG